MFPSLLLDYILNTHSSSMLGWNIRFVNPILGDLYGYESGSSTWTFQIPPSKGAIGYGSAMWLGLCDGARKRGKLGRFSLSVGPRNRT